MSFAPQIVMPLQANFGFGDIERNKTNSNYLYLLTFLANKADF